MQRSGTPCDACFSVLKIGAGTEPLLLRPEQKGGGRKTTERQGICWPRGVFLKAELTTVV